MEEKMNELCVMLHSCPGFHLEGRHKFTILQRVFTEIEFIFSLIYKDALLKFNIRKEIRNLQAKKTFHLQYLRNMCQNKIVRTDGFTN